MLISQEAGPTPSKTREAWPSLADRREDGYFRALLFEPACRSPAICVQQADISMAQRTQRAAPLRHWLLVETADDVQTFFKVCFCAP